MVSKQRVEAVPSWAFDPAAERKSKQELLWIQLGVCEHYLKHSEKMFALPFEAE